MRRGDRLVPQKEGTMKPRRRQLLHLAAGAAALPASVDGAWANRIRHLSICSVLFAMVPVGCEAATLAVDCDTGEKIQQKVAVAKPGDEIVVTGTCKEGVIIPSEIVRITLNGQGKATIEPPGTPPGGPPIISIFIRGKESRSAASRSSAALTAFTFRGPLPVPPRSSTTIRFAGRRGLEFT
jgi:hypothetical protein